jgi:hypothetical protein
MSTAGTSSTIHPKVLREQLVTISDLKQFKEELLVSLFHLIREHLDKQPRKWIKSREVRQLLGISNGTLVTMRLNGSLPYTKIGNLIYYDMDDISKMLVNGQTNQAVRSIIPPKKTA